MVGEGLLLQQLHHLLPLRARVLRQHHLVEDLAEVGVENLKSARCKHLETTETKFLGDELILELAARLETRVERQRCPEGVTVTNPEVT